MAGFSFPSFIHQVFIGPLQCCSRYYAKRHSGEGEKEVVSPWSFQLGEESQIITLVNVKLQLSGTTKEIIHNNKNLIYLGHFEGE